MLSITQVHARDPQHITKFTNELHEHVHVHTRMMLFIVKTFSNTADLL